MPALESGALPARPPIAAGGWYNHLDGGFPVLGVRFGGLKSVSASVPSRTIWTMD
jgi:hypothetical protein